VNNIPSISVATFWQLLKENNTSPVSLEEVIKDKKDKEVQYEFPSFTVTMRFQDDL